MRASLDCNASPIETESFTGTYAESWLFAGTICLKQSGARSDRMHVDSRSPWR
jgi:hypothetical protein